MENKQKAVIHTEINAEVHGKLTPSLAEKIKKHTETPEFQEKIEDAHDEMLERAKHKISGLVCPIHWKRAELVVHRIGANINYKIKACCKVHHDRAAQALRKQ